MPPSKRSRAFQMHFDGPYADFWKEQARRYGCDAGHQRLIDLVADLVPEGGLLLDCGMGNGFPFSIAWSRRLRLAGCDLSSKALGLARPELEGGAGERLSAGDLAALPFRTGSASVTVCARASNYVADLGDALKELWRVTAAGGALVLDCFNRCHPDRRRAWLSMAIRTPWRLINPLPGQQHSVRIASTVKRLETWGASVRLFDDQGFPMRDPEPWSRHPTVWIVARKP